MTRSATEWRGALLKALPRGQAFARGIGTNMAKLMHAFGDRFADTETQALALYNEVMPDTTSDTVGLTDWERVAGLPESCLSDNDISQTESERQAALLEKLARNGSNSSASTIDGLIAGSGLNGTVTDELGVTKCGEAICGEAVVSGEGEAFTFVVTSTETGADEQAALTCLVDKYKPAHTAAVISFP